MRKISTPNSMLKIITIFNWCLIAFLAFLVILPHSTRTNPAQ